MSCSRSDVAQTMLWNHQVPGWTAFSLWGEPPPRAGSSSWQLLEVRGCRWSPQTLSLHFVHVHGCDWLLLLDSHAPCWLTAGVLVILPVLQRPDNTTCGYFSAPKCILSGVNTGFCGVHWAQVEKKKIQQCTKRTLRFIIYAENSALMYPVFII